MSREKGTFNFSANLEVKKQGPLDARQTMISYAELIQAATWQDSDGKMYLFDGLIVPVTNGSEKQVYMLIDAAKYNQTSAWLRVDAGAVKPTTSKPILQLGDLSLFKQIYSYPTNYSEIVEAVGVDISTLKSYIEGNKYTIAAKWGEHTVYAVFTDTSESDGITLGFIVYKQDDENGGNHNLFYETIKLPLKPGGSPMVTVTGDSFRTRPIGSSCISVSDTGAIVLRIDSAQKILGSGTGGLKATIGLKYDSGSKKIVLTGINDAEIASIDATAFIKDGMINTVELVTNPEDQPAGTYIKVTFNTDAGKEPIFLNVTSLIDLYTSGNGISISGKTISMKLDPSTEEYLQLSSSGLKITGVTDAIATAISSAFSWHDVG